MEAISTSTGASIENSGLKNHQATKYQDPPEKKKHHRNNIPKNQESKIKSQKLKATIEVKSNPNAYKLHIKKSGNLNCKKRTKKGRKQPKTQISNQTQPQSQKSKKEVRKSEEGEKNATQNPNQWGKEEEAAKEEEVNSQKHQTPTQQAPPHSRPTNNYPPTNRFCLQRPISAIPVCFYLDSIVRRAGRERFILFTTSRFFGPRGWGRRG